MKITENFTLQELTHSNYAVSKGLPNIPNQELIENLKKLAIKLLLPLRTIYKEPFIINSGYRSPEVNKGVKGVDTSQHLLGKAADVSVKNPRDLLKKLIESKLIFDLAILYQDGKNNFLHMSYNETRNRLQVLYSKGTKPS